MFTVRPALHSWNSQWQISLAECLRISVTLLQPFPFSTRVPSDAGLRAVCKLVTSRLFWVSKFLSTQVDVNKYRQEFPANISLQNHYVKEMFWLQDALLSSWDYRGLLAFRASRACLHFWELSNRVLLKSKQAEMSAACQYHHKWNNFVFFLQMLHFSRVLHHPCHQYFWEGGWDVQQGSYRRTIQRCTLSSCNNERNNMIVPASLLIAWIYGLLEGVAVYHRSPPPPRLHPHPQLSPLQTITTPTIK